MQRISQLRLLRSAWILLSVLFVSNLLLAQDTKELARHFRDLDPAVLSKQQKREAAGMIHRDLRRRRDQANAQNRAEWQAVKTRQDWEDYRDARLRQLRASLGRWPSPRATLAWHVTGVVEGDGFRIENIVYESRPGDWVAGNLYVPSIDSDSMPGLLIVHSHHRDKTHGELQDMGMTWARAGCLVLVLDQVGYGERRAHPFHGPEDFAGDFKVGRQDYYYRYDSGIQLRLAGDSLMGWFVWDLMRGVDLLLSRETVDPQRIVILGSVAGGGDPCAVTAALDERIACAVPFNFGGLQPESYPLPDNAEETFNFAMSSYWDSTRGLPDTCSGGFFHWLIVGSIAPRPLIYAHEFMWDRENDPVWKRFQRIYNQFYGEGGNLAFAVGKGSVKDSADIATHCTHIGAYHRQFIHPAFERWFGIKVDPSEYSNRVDAAELRCMTHEFRDRLKPLGLVELVSDLGDSRLASARHSRRPQSQESKRRTLRREFEQRLGATEPAMPRVLASSRDVTSLPGAIVNRLLLQTEEGITVPLLLIAPAAGDAATPTVIGISQSGKAAFLSDRAETITALIQAGVAVCLPDVRGTGETRVASARGRTSGDTNLSVNMQMFGETLLGQRMRDLRSVLLFLRSRDDVDDTRLALWGDSFAEPNPTGTDFDVPHDATRVARQPEPLGGLLAMFVALCEDDLRAACVSRGLVSYASILDSPHVYVPHDAVVPQALNTGDLSDIAAAIAPTRLRLSSMVDALNRPVGDDEVSRAYVSSREHPTLEFGGEGTTAEWLIGALK